MPAVILILFDFRWDPISSLMVVVDRTTLPLAAAI
jgi:hypothetical protein